MSEDTMMYEYEEERDAEFGFRVTDDAKAKWCVDRMREAEEEYARMAEWYEGMIKKAQAKRDATVERMTAYLREYADMVPMKETKTQYSYPIPGGKIVRKKAHVVMNHDDKVILEALKRDGRDEYIKTVVTEKLDWAGLKKEINETGEMVDGVTMEEVPEETVIQLDKSEE